MRYYFWVTSGTCHPLLLVNVLADGRAGRLNLCIMDTGDHADRVQLNEKSEIQQGALRKPI